MRSPPAAVGGMCGAAPYASSMRPTPACGIGRWVPGPLRRWVPGGVRPSDPVPIHLSSEAGMGWGGNGAGAARIAIGARMSLLSGGARHFVRESHAIGAECPQVAAMSVIGTTLGRRPRGRVVPDDRDRRSRASAALSPVVLPGVPPCASRRPSSPLCRTLSEAGASDHAAWPAWPFDGAARRDERRSDGPPTDRCAPPPRRLSWVVATARRLEPPYDAALSPVETG